MRKFVVPVFTFAVIVVTGGVYGFVKAHSIASLVMGASFGAVLCLCSLLIRQERLAALYVATSCVVILHLFFLYRFLKNFKLMPAGIMVLLSTALGAPLLAYLTKRIKETVYQEKS